jgi:hypothetical protein
VCLSNELILNSSIITINYWKYIYEEEKEEAEVKGGSKCEDRKEMEGPKEVCV